MTENDVNPPINDDPMEKRNEFIDHPLYIGALFKTSALTAHISQFSINKSCMKNTIILYQILCVQLALII